MNLRNLFRRNTFEHGVHPQEHKELTSVLPIRRLPFAPQLILPLSQHAGAPAVPLVKPGQEVVRGEPVARADGFVSVPMHAPATGRVEAIQLPNRQNCFVLIGARTRFHRQDQRPARLQGGQGRGPGGLESAQYRSLQQPVFQDFAAAFVSDVPLIEIDGLREIGLNHDHCLALAVEQESRDPFLSC